MPFPNDLWSSEWERRRVRNQLHLTFTGCLGPCAVGNSAVLLIHGRSIWLKDLNTADLVTRLFDYAENMLGSGQVEPAPPELREHIYERFVAPPDAPYQPLGDAIEDDGAGLDRLDPVCLMDVDPATARWKTDHDGRTYYFCAPSCRRTFLADPAAYAIA